MNLVGALPFGKWLRRIGGMGSDTETLRHEMRDTCALVALAFSIRAVFAWGTPRALDSADAIHYIETASQWVSGNFSDINPGIPPLYPLLAALLHPVLSDGETACMAVSFLASILLVPVVYGLARDLHGPSAARMAGLTAALWPWLVDYAGRVGPDALACTLWMAAVWALSRAIRRGGGQYIVSAALAFTALHLARAEGLLVFVASLVIAPCCLKPSNRDGWMRFAAFAGTAIILTVLCAFAAKFTIGHTMFGDRMIRLFQDWSVTPFEVARMREPAVDPFGVVSRHVLIPLAHTIVTSLFNVVPTMLGPVLMIFMGVGLLAPSKPRDARLESFVLAFAGVQWILTLPVLSPEPRYLMAPLVAMSLWTARGAADVSARLRTHDRRRWLASLPVAAIVATLLLGLAIMAAADFLRPTPARPVEYKTAGHWMKHHLTPGLIFTRKPQIGYYAGMPSTGPDAQDTIEKAVERARHAGARYFVVDERYTAQMAPDLAPLLDPAHAPPDLKHLKSFAPFPGGRVIIYEIKIP